MPINRNPDDQDATDAAEARRLQALSEARAAARQKQADLTRVKKRIPWGTICATAALVLVAFGLAGQSWGWFAIGTPPS